MESVSSEPRAPATTVCGNCSTANPVGAAYCADCRNFLPGGAMGARRPPSTRPVLGLFCAVVAAVATLLVVSPGMMFMLFVSGFVPVPHGGGPGSTFLLLLGLAVWIGLAVWAGRRAYWSIADGASWWPYVVGAVAVGAAGWKVWTGPY